MKASWAVVVAVVAAYLCPNSELETGENLGLFKIQRRIKSKSIFIYK